MFRCIMAALTSLAIALLAGPKVIRWLIRKKIGDRPEFYHEALNQLMRDRANTPTMGGLIILGAILAGTLSWARLDNPFIHKAIFLVVWFGTLGAVDDWLKLTSKLRQRSRDGLKAWEKLLFQFGGAVLIASFLYGDFANLDDGRSFWVPFYKHGIPLANWPPAASPSPAPYLSSCAMSPPNLWPAPAS
jgi:phospho-N-acetylmuramoyl-pentapeptide-transferase